MPTISFKKFFKSNIVIVLKMYNYERDGKKKQDAQTRLTLTDCERNQVKLIDIIKGNIRYNQPIQSMKYERWTDIVNKSFMAQANNVGASINFSNGRIVPLGRNLHEFALRMYFLKGKKIKIRDTNSGEKEVFDIADLWKILYNGALGIFGYAVQEARNISREREIKDEPSSYVFSSDKKV